MAVGGDDTALAAMAAPETAHWLLHPVHEDWQGCAGPDGDGHRDLGLRRHRGRCRGSQAPGEVRVRRAASVSGGGPAAPLPVDPGAPPPADATPPPRVTRPPPHPPP